MAIKRKPLTSFAVGDSLRIFQSNDEIYYNKNFNTEASTTTGLLSTNIDSLNFKYLMYNENTPSLNNNNISKVLNGSFSSDFIAYITKSINDETSTTYYDEDQLSFNESPIKIFQIEKKCYFLKNDSYKNDEKDDWNSYNIYQKNPSLLSSDLTYFDLINDNIKNYNENFINTSKNVNNKSIPIYDLNKTALKDLYIIKLFNQEEILNVLKENNLINISGLCLFNSKTYLNDVKDFDSILIQPIYTYFDGFSLEDRKENAFNNFFKSLFKRIPKESLYRILIPVGQINIDGEDNKKLNDKNQYMYSIDLSDSNNSFVKTNYFSLKNFTNPEMNYTYKVPNIDKYLTCEISSNIDGYEELNPRYYNFDGKIKFSIIEDYMNIVVKGITKYIDDNNMYKTSASFIEQNNLKEPMIEEFKKYYTKVDEATINEIFYNQTNYDYKEKYLIAFKLYMLNVKGISLEESVYLVNSLDIKNKLNELFKEFNKSFNLLINRIESDKEKFKNVFDAIQYGSDNFKSALNYLDNLDNNNLPITDNVIEIILDKLDANNIINKKIDSSLEIEKDLNYTKLFETLGKIPSNSNLNIKINDYNSHITDLYKHDNSFKLSGYLYGMRDYTNCGLNSDDDIWLSYNFKSNFNKEFLESILNTSISSLIKSKEETINIISSYINYVDENFNNTSIMLIRDVESKLNMLSSFSSFSLSSFTEIIPKNDVENNYVIENEKIIFKDKDDTFIISNEVKILSNYFKMLNELKKFEFGEIVKGQHYYKESQCSKSNIFSIDVKNSGFVFKLYSFKDILKVIAYENPSLNIDLSIDYNEASNDEMTFEIKSKIKESNFYGIFNKNNYNMNIENIYNKTNSIYNNIESLKNIMFFKYNEPAYEDLCFENIDFIYDNIDILNSAPKSFLIDPINDNIITNHKNDLSKLDKFINLNNQMDVLIFEIKRFKHLKDSLNISKINLWEKNLLKSFKISYVNIENYKNYKKNYPEKNYDRYIYGTLNDFIKENKTLLVKKEYEIIKAKYKMQKYFENAVRKSIHRYIPANTTLWKIQYSGK